MTDTTVDLGLVQAAASDPLRPADPDTGWPRLFRRLVGVRETVLDWAPEERPRYTRLGLLVVNTGLMASVAAFAALHRTLGLPWYGVVPVALFWGFLVICVDTWMISSTHGVLGGQRLLMVVPRLVMALLIGVVIAEPLVLWIFHPAIEAEVTQSRQADVDTHASRWSTCNPEDGTSTQDRADCVGFQLGLVSPQSTQQKLAKLESERTALAAQVADLTAQLNEKQRFAADECAGVKRQGTSGDAGKGFRCDQAWKVAGDFEKSVDLPGKRDQVSGLDQQIAGLTAELATSRHTYATEVARHVAEKKAARAASYREIDIIDQVRGLESLSKKSSFVGLAHWLVTVLFIVVDSLPILAKMLGGSTTYDLMVHRKVHAGAHSQNRLLQIRDRAGQAETDVALRQIDHARDVRMNAIAEQDRVAQAQYDEDLEAEIERRTARYAGREEPR